MEMSVMFITHNRKKELIRAIESCVQNKMNEMEIIVVDNHSEDGTQTIVENYLKQCKLPYKYKFLSENLGVSEGRNLAFDLCEGKYVFCLDDDALIKTDHFFKKIYDRMESFPDAVAAAVEIYEPETENYLKGFVYEKNGIKYAHSYIGAAHLLRREAFLGRKLYPDKLRFGSEEAYVAYRIWAMGKKMLYFDDLCVFHLPSKISRVYGTERKLSIIVNNHVVRNLCYPNVIRPILYLTFRNRLFRHKLCKEYSYKEIKQMVRDRYDESNVFRMRLSIFLKMFYTIGPKWSL